uniref:Uncharacterized protein n=1 Tax=Myotis myotis TaxID=51298 RepID=A0A7J7SRH8_MYOMY|nr:hypothetical protein mMyoMyo1_009435 [Myotis myotis]
MFPLYVSYGQLGTVQPCSPAYALSRGQTQTLCLMAGTRPTDPEAVLLRRFESKWWQGSVYTKECFSKDSDATSYCFNVGCPAPMSLPEVTLCGFQVNEGREVAVFPVGCSLLSFTGSQAVGFQTRVPSAWTLNPAYVPGLPHVRCMYVYFKERHRKAFSIPTLLTTSPPRPDWPGPLS